MSRARSSGDAFSSAQTTGSVFLRFRMSPASDLPESSELQNVPLTSSAIWKAMPRS